MDGKTLELETALSPLTREILGQYPRPWMTDLEKPGEAELFIVGANPATPHLSARIGTHKRFLDAMFNRNGECCRRLYAELRPNPSGTRSHSDNFVAMLTAAGVTKLIETNTVCFATESNFKQVYRPENREGLRTGIRIFRTVLDIIAPKIVVVHGSGVVKSVLKNHQMRLAPPPTQPDEFPYVEIKGTKFFTIRSLGLPEVNKWPFDRDQYLRRLTTIIAGELVRVENPSR